MSVYWFRELRAEDRGEEPTRFRVVSTFRSRPSASPDCGILSAHIPSSQHSCRLAMRAALWSRHGARTLVEQDNEPAVDIDVDEFVHQMEGCLCVSPM